MVLHEQRIGYGAEPDPYQGWGRRGLQGAAGRHARERVEEERRAQYEDQWTYDDEFWGSTCPSCGERRPECAVVGCACSCEKARRDELAASYFKEHQPAYAAARIDKANIPRRYQGCTFESFTEREGTGRALEACRAWAEDFTLETDGGLFLSGDFGSGKTHLAVASLTRAIERTLVEGRYVSAGALVGEVRAGERITWKPVDDAIREELLVLDDLGQDAATEFTRDVVARVVHGRYEAARPTIITTNLGPQRLGDLFGGAVVSRIHEMGERIAVQASDYRRRKIS